MNPDRPMDLDRIRTIAMALPEVTEKPHFNLVSFRVRDRIVAAVTADRSRAHVHVDGDTVDEHVAADDETYQPLTRGTTLLGLSVDLHRVDPEAFAELVEAAWRHRAPRRLVKDHEAPSSAAG